MKKTILVQIQEIKSEKSLTTRQKWRAILEIETFRKRGAIEARKIQDEIKSKWKVIRDRVHSKSTPKWESPAQRVVKYNRKQAEILHQNQLLADDAANGYPLTLLTGSTSGSLSCVAIGNLVAGNTRQYANIHGWIVSSSESVTKSWDSYSKAWHRQHGPKITIDARTVLIRRMHNGKVESFDVKIDSWRGAWAVKTFNSASIKAAKEKVALEEYLEQLCAQNDQTYDEYEDDVCVSI